MMYIMQKWMDGSTVHFPDAKKYTATDLRLSQVPEAPVNTHRPREATAVGPTETTTAPACQNFTTGAHAILAAWIQIRGPEQEIPAVTRVRLIAQKHQY